MRLPPHARVICPIKSGRNERSELHFLFPFIFFCTSFFINLSSSIYGISPFFLYTLVCISMFASIYISRFNQSPALPSPFSLPSQSVPNHPKMATHEIRVQITPISSLLGSHPQHLGRHPFVAMVTASSLFLISVYPSHLLFLQKLYSEFNSSTHRSLSFPYICSPSGSPPDTFPARLVSV